DSCLLRRESTRPERVWRRTWADRQTPKRDQRAHPSPPSPSLAVPAPPSNEDAGFLQAELGRRHVGGTHPVGGPRAAVESSLPPSPCKSETGADLFPSSTTASTPPPSCRRTSRGWVNSLSGPEPTPSPPSAPPLRLRTRGGVVGTRTPPSNALSPAPSPLPSHRRASRRWRFCPRVPSGHRRHRCRCCPHPLGLSPQAERVGLLVGHHTRLPIAPSSFDELGSWMMMLAHPAMTRPRQRPRRCATCSLCVSLGSMSRIVVTADAPCPSSESDVGVLVGYFVATARGHSHLRLRMRAGCEVMLLSRELEPLIIAFP
ncbi:LOW QUALITY PROTEIN: hypothetical protein CVT26_006539, partial [Gymnopilus dilepis]